MVFEYILERFRTAYKYFACPHTKDGIKSKSDTKKKEKGKIGIKKTGEPVTNCCLPQQANIRERENTSYRQEREFDECSEMESASRRCTSENLTSFLVKKPEIINTNSEGREEIVSFITNESCELEQKSVPTKDDQELTIEVELSHHCGSSEARRHCADALRELSDNESRLSAEMNYPQKSMCSDTSKSATSHNCKAEEIQDTKDEGITEDMHYVFDKFILTSGKVKSILGNLKTLFLIESF